MTSGLATTVSCGWKRSSAGVFPPEVKVTVWISVGSSIFQVTVSPGLIVNSCGTKRRIVNLFATDPSRCIVYVVFPALSVAEVSIPLRIRAWAVAKDAFASFWPIVSYSAWVLGYGDPAGWTTTAPAISGWNIQR